MPTRRRQLRIVRVRVTRLVTQHAPQEPDLVLPARPRASLTRATFDRVELSAGDVASITLTAEADERGLWRSLPKEIPQRWLACPRGLEPPTFRSAT